MATNYLALQDSGNNGGGEKKNKERGRKIKLEREPEQMETKQKTQGHREKDIRAGETVGEVNNRAPMAHSGSF